MTADEQKDFVLRFFKAWETGSTADIRRAYDEYLSDDCVYENTGVPAAVGKEAILAFVDSAAASIGVSTMEVELFHIAVGDNVVFTERVDWHRDGQGELTLSPKIAGVMIFDGDRISRWSDYYEPTAFLEGLAKPPRQHEAV